MAFHNLLDVFETNFKELWVIHSFLAFYVSHNIVDHLAVLREITCKA